MVATDPSAPNPSATNPAAEGPAAPEPAAASAVAPVRRHWAAKVGPVAVAGVAIGGCVAAGLIDPERTTVFPPCPFRAVTGWYCPGCGMTRALHRLVRGDFTIAAQYNLLLVALVPLAFYAILQWAASTYGWCGGRLKPMKFTKPVWISCIAIVTAWAVLRNTPIPYLEDLARGRL